MTQFNQIFIANSVYAEFLYLLRFPEKVESTLFLVGPSCAGIDVPNRLPIVGPKNMNDLPVLQQNLSTQTFLLLKGKKVPCYGNVETIYSSFFVNNFPFYPITDGLWDIQKFPRYLLDYKHFVKFYTVRYLGGIDTQDERIEYLNIPTLWKRLDKSKQKIFVQRFGVSEKDFTNFKEKSILFVTQPLTEDGITSEDQKIELYKSIMSQYDVEKVIIKPHPREKTDWKKVFPDVPVIPQILPAELLSLLLPKLDKMVTFFSTSACTILPAEKVDFYAKDFNQLYMMDNNRFDGDKPLRPLASFDVENALKKNKFNWLRLPDTRYYKK